MFKKTGWDFSKTSASGKVVGTLFSVFTPKRDRKLCASCMTHRGGGGADLGRGAGGPAGTPRNDMVNSVAPLLVSRLPDLEQKSEGPRAASRHISKPPN